MNNPVRIDITSLYNDIEQEKKKCIYVVGGCGRIVEIIPADTCGDTCSNFTPKKS